ncbi:GntR family transcriptional regulator [Streptomyces sp. MAR4 CNY-716]
MQIDPGKQKGNQVAQASRRGTFLEIAEEVKAQIADDPEMTRLPTVAEIMERRGVSRGVVLRAFDVLRTEGVAEPVPGARWRVVRAGELVDRRPLEERIADIVVADGLEEGEAFPSASALAERFGVSRPTVTKALNALEAAGVLASEGQGKARTVRALSVRKEG